MSSHFIHNPKLIQNFNLIYEHVISIHKNNPFHLIHREDILKWVCGDLKYLSSINREYENT